MLKKGTCDVPKYVGRAEGACMRSGRAQEEALRVRPVVPVGLETDYVELMQQCWSTDKDRRPGMSAVVARLRQIRRRLGQPAPKDAERAEEVCATVCAMSWPDVVGTYLWR